MTIRYRNLEKVPRRAQSGVTLESREASADNGAILQAVLLFDYPSAELLVHYKATFTVRPLQRRELAAVRESSF